MTTVNGNGQDIQNSRGLEPNGLARIKGFVQRFAVCWETHPEQAVVTVLDPKEQAPRSKAELRKIGFSLELYGTPEPGAEDVSAGCDRCLRVQSALKEIADWILPREEQQCTYEIGMEPQSLIYSRVRAGRPDLRVTVQILHRNNWGQPIDECEERCLRDMERGLHEVGASEGAWSAPDTRIG